MLTPRQQQCLQGIGIRLWRERTEADTANDNPVFAAPDPADPAGETAGLSPLAAEPARLDDGVQQAIRSFVEGKPGPDPESGGEATQAPAAEAPRPLPELRDWEQTIAAIHACSACELAQNCTQKVPGVGNPRADLLIVGEGPGHDEDIRGEPFVGRSGQLLDRMLAAIGISREQVYITNIVKCRPPNNRDPRPDEAASCRHYLEAQIRQIEPRVILSVGRVSAHNLLGSSEPVGRLIRQDHRLPGSDIPVKVTYHPAYLLRNPSAKSIAWQDLKQLQRMLR